MNRIYLPALTVFLFLVLTTGTLPAADNGISGKWRSESPASTLTVNRTKGRYRWMFDNGRCTAGAYAFSEADGLELESSGSWATYRAVLSGDTLRIKSPGGESIIFHRKSSVSSPESSPAEPIVPAGHIQQRSLSGLWSSPAGMVLGFIANRHFFWVVPGKTIQGAYTLTGNKLLLRAGAGPIPYRIKWNQVALTLTDKGQNTIRFSPVRFHRTHCPVAVTGHVFTGRTGEKLLFGTNRTLEIISSSGKKVWGRYIAGRGELQISGIPGFPSFQACTATGNLFLKTGGRIYIFLLSGRVGRIGNPAAGSGKNTSIRGKWKSRDGSYWAFYKDGTVDFGPENQIVSGHYRQNGHRLVIELDRSHRHLEFSVSVSGITAQLKGMGRTFTLKRNDRKRRNHLDSWFWSPGSNPNAYGFTWENTWSTGSGW